MAPLTDGKLHLVGLFGPEPEAAVAAVREVGFRKIDNEHVPILHAKLALLGDMCWTDEHPSGHVVDHIFFVPRQLRVGSENLTGSSRQSLEFGIWLTAPSMLKAA